MFMENKFIKIGGIAGLLILVSVTLYYIFVFLPDQRLYERQLKCADAGAKYSKGLESKSDILVMKYIYSPQLKTCIIRYDTFFKDSLLRGGASSIIRDVYTGSELYIKSRDEELFNQKEKELFGTNFRSI